MSLGKMLVKENGEPARQVNSKFGASVRERALKLQRRHSWQTHVAEARNSYTAAGNTTRLDEGESILQVISF